MPLVDRYFFREAYDAQQIMHELSQKVRGLISQPEQLLDLVVSKTKAVFHIKGAVVILFDGTPLTASLPFIAHFDDPQKKALVEDLDDFHQGAIDINAQPLSILLNQLASEQQHAELMNQNTSLLVPLSSSNDVIGMIALGGKSSEEPFSAEDKDLLMTLASQTSLALENSSLTKKVIEQETVKTGNGAGYSGANQYVSLMYFPIILMSIMLGFVFQQVGLVGIIMTILN